MSMETRPALAPRNTEALLLAIVIVLAFLGFVLVSTAESFREGTNPLLALPGALLPPFILAVSLIGLHGLLRWQGVTAEQVLLPSVALLVAVGLVVIWRLRPSAAWQQLLRGWVPGVLLIALLLLRADLLERIRRSWPMTISVAGLLLLLLTGFFGSVDETGARLALKLGPLPAVQTSEWIKLALIIFLAWYLEREGAAAEGRARPIGWVRLPAIRYFIPGTLYVFLAVIALVKMSDLGAILILGCLFISMMYAGFETRVFLPVAAIGVALVLVVGVVLALTWEAPTVIQQRWVAFQNPWSRAPQMIGGEPTGLTIAEGPGYQLQQSIYAVIAGGVTGTGLGFGLPGNVPLAHSDFIFAALVEELGAIAGLAVLAFFAIVFLRILRVSVLLPPQQVFERLLLVGISVHLFAQVFVMVGGTLNLLPVTGLTVPFLSQGGMALLVNLLEVGIALALARRLEGGPA